jgi:hypothetical protein
MSERPFPMAALFGVRVQFSDYATVPGWVFPKKRFVEYEPKDERWCRYFRIGYEGHVPGMLQIGSEFFVHSSLKESFFKALDQASKTSTEQ